MPFSLPPPESQSSRSHYFQQSLETVIRLWEKLLTLLELQGGIQLNTTLSHSHMHTLCYYGCCVYVNINELQYSVTDIRWQLYRAVQVQHASSCKTHEDTIQTLHSANADQTSVHMWRLNIRQKKEDMKYVDTPTSICCCNRLPMLIINWQRRM